MRLSGVLFLCCYGSLISCFLVIVSANSNDDDEWIDPYDMLNYDPSTKSMRKPAEASSFSNVPTKRREYSQEPQCPHITECTNKLDNLQREFEVFKRRVSFSSEQPTCNPVFKRFLAKLLKEIDKLGLPTSVNTDMHYDAEVKLSKQMVEEIQKLLSDENSWRTGALDDALSQILINFKLHDQEAWKWRFEDTFSVEIETVIKVFLLVLIVVGIICTELWSWVSWFVQFKRMFAICFFISIVWNWFYLYKVAFAEHQSKYVKMENMNEKCSGVKKIDWKDNLWEWYRTTWTLQDDPCKQYYETILVDPLLVVPPMKAITITITTFITDPLKQIGQGISEFLRALLKDLPITLQIPVLLTIVIAIVVFMYGSAQAAIQHVALRPLRGGRHDPPPAVEQPPAQPLREPEREEEGGGGGGRWAGGDADRDPLPRPRAGQEGNRVNREGENGRPDIRQRRPNRHRDDRQKVFVETLRNADHPYSGDETDTLQEAEAEASAQQHTEEPVQAEVVKEDSEKSNKSPEVKYTKPAPERQNAASNNVDNTTSTENQSTRVAAPACVLGSPCKQEPVESIGSPVQETLR